MTVVVGVDGSGRSHRLDEIARAASEQVVRIDPHAQPDSQLVRQLDDALARGCLVLVDDAHRLPTETLRDVTRAGRRGLALVIARRPSIDRPELAELDEVAAAHGGVQRLEPLDVAGVAVLVRHQTGRPASPETALAVREASAGMPTFAAALAGVAPGEVPAALAARVHRRLAVLDPVTVHLVRILALQLELDDQVLAAAAEAQTAWLAAAMRELRDDGLLVPDGERLIPAVAAAVAAEMTPAERRRLHDEVAAAMLSAGTDTVVVAVQLRAAHARGAVAADAYRTAGERLRFSDPGAAVGWFDDAVDAGADPAVFAVTRAEAAASLGLPSDVASLPTTDPADAARLGLVEGASAAHQGRTTRSADALLAAGPPGHSLAVPALVATGRLDEARIAAAGPAPTPVRRFAEAAIAATKPTAALALLIEAAEAFEATPPALVLPDTPHAVGALVAVTAGDAATAEHLLDRGLANGIGGPIATERYRLLRAWVRLRTGRYETAVAELRQLRIAELPGRERLLAAAIAAGIARRSGDISALQEAWTAVEQVLARREVDLLHVEAVEELAVAAVRLRRHQRIEPVLEMIESALDLLGNPPAWAVSCGWVRLQMAVAGDDAAAAAAAAQRLERVAADAPRQQAQCRAATVWAASLGGRVDTDQVLAHASELAAVELPWEGSRLAGHAAIRTNDPSAARRLLERARELSGADVAAEEAATEAGDGSRDARLAGLSEREVEVARLVLAGRTHREIGAQLYIAPKTVEHHVARIRGKLGATSRAEFVAALREALDVEHNPGI